MKKIILFPIFAFFPLLLSAQYSFIVEGGTVTISDSVHIILNDGQLQNNGSFTASKGTVSMQGTSSTSQSEIGGTGTYDFYNLNINKSANDVQLATDITINNEIEMIAGKLDILANDLTLGTTNGTITGETESSHITSTSTGSIIKAVDLNAPNAQNPGNLGISISSSANLGLTEIRRGHDHQTVTSGNSIFRHFTITPTNNSALDASLTFHYLDAELNGLAESALVLQENNNGWMVDGFDSRDASTNTVTFSGYDALYQYTLGANEDDADMDGISAAMDNCTEVANANQADSDNDLYGDACDTCPNGDDAIDANNNAIIDDCECKTEEMEVTGTMTDDSTYVASSTIISTEVIANNYEAIYKANESITLTAGFHVETGATFLATIATCEMQPYNLQMPAISKAKIAKPLNDAATLAVSPNPFVNNTAIHYTIPQNSKVTMVIQDVNGQQLAVLLDNIERNKGQYELDWSAVDLPAGIYFLAMDDGRQKQTQKLVLMSQ